MGLNLKEWVIRYPFTERIFSYTFPLKLHNILDGVNMLEESCIETVENGKMTKDLAILVKGEDVQPETYLYTEEFLDAVKATLEAKLPVVA